jgi:hypothetical protein
MGPLPESGSARTGTDRRESSSLSLSMCFPLQGSNPVHGISYPDPHTHFGGSNRSSVSAML